MLDSRSAIVVIQNFGFFVDVIRSILPLERRFVVMEAEGL
jgi:hypothetical protein